ncbi:MAG TPA: radical SAM protein [bacterium]|nr:radical SAM protein [bacterium]
MKIAFVHLGRENLGIEYLSAVLKQDGHTVALHYDPGLFGINDNVFYVPRLEKRYARDARIVSEIIAAPPDLLCFSVYTGTYQWCLDIARRVRDHVRGPIVFGGIHVTLVPHEVMKHEVVDYALVGEGEEAMRELVAKLAAGEDPRGTANLCWRENGEVRCAPLRPPLADLDTLPLPDKALFENWVNMADDYLVMTVRGCPFSCAYCCESAINRIYNRRFLRRRSVDAVIDELELMARRYDYREVMFNDSILFGEKAWLLDLLEKYRRRVRKPFRCFGQVKFLDEEIAQALAESGCYAIEFGLQTLNESIRRNILQRSESNEEAERAFRLCDRYKLRYDIDHIFGLPEESVADFEFAARFYRSLTYLNRIKCHNLTYFPATPIIDAARERGMLSERNVRDIDEGRTGDFFHEYTFFDDEQRAQADAFRKLYKFLPLLPRRFVDWLTENRRWRHIRKIPGPLIILAQILGAVRGRDYRFWLYIKYYLLRLRRLR